jgi:methyl-accepting chemotaxis protein
MNPFFRRFIGISFIVFAVLGILISLGGIYGTWRVRAVMLQKFSETSELVDQALSATYDGLGAVDQMLSEVMQTIDSSQNMLQAMSQTMGDIKAFSSGFLSRFRLMMPGLSQENSAPEEQSSSIEVFETELQNIADNFVRVNGAMTETRTVMQEYQQTVADTQTQLQEMQASGSRWITTLTWILTVLLAWFAITQAGFILQGIEFIRTAKERQAANAEDPAPEY